MWVAAYKYNVIERSAHGQAQYTTWHGKPTPARGIFAFGQRGTGPIHPKNEELHSRYDAVRYMYGFTDTIIAVLNFNTQHYKHMRAAKFGPYHPAKDPTHLYAAAFASHSARAIRTYITTTTPDPATFSQTQQYPDAPQWAEAHDRKLDTLDDKHKFRWLAPADILPGIKFIPLKILCRYKWNTDGTINTRKARCSVRGDLMKPSLHYDRNAMTAYMARKPQCVSCSHSKLSTICRSNTSTSRPHIYMNHTTKTTPCTFGSPNGQMERLNLKV